MQSVGFEKLLPESVISGVEKAVGLRLTGLVSPLPSYINRVYELLDVDGNRLVAKFYRPGRWHRDAIDAEHVFLADCAADEIPAVQPLQLVNGGTVSCIEGFYFTVFPKRGGREFEPNEDDDWRRVGRLVGRIHVAGAHRSASSRITLAPRNATADAVKFLLDGGFVSTTFRGQFQETCGALIEIAVPLFDGTPAIRVHGDCHQGNLLHRPDDGLMIIDFDDMAMGPPVQDLWLLLPDRVARCRHEIELMLEGYETFCSFDRRTLELIEPLRAMRMIYYLSWCACQSRDYRFKAQFPDWGTDGFWQTEINDLTRQLHVIQADTRVEDNASHWQRQGAV
jgi:Ser/Thr protein kinase RdoA (MazF antagonist)